MAMPRKASTDSTSYITNNLVALSTSSPQQELSSASLSCNKINYNELEFAEEPLDSGGFAWVFSGVWKNKDEKKNVAIKRINNKDFSEEIRSEIEIMHQLHSKYVVEFYGYVQSPPCIVMEYIPKCLHRVIESKEDLPDWSSVSQKIIHGIAQGLNYLHQNNVLHCDVKPMNVLLDEKYNVKLCDFGCAIKTEQDIHKSNKVRGTASHMAPEAFEDEDDDYRYSNSKKTDIYSLGVTIWETVHRKTFFKGIGYLGCGGKVKRGDREEISANCSPEIASLIRRCWNQNPKERPTASEVVACLEEQSNIKKPQDDSKQEVNHILGVKLGNRAQ